MNKACRHACLFLLLSPGLFACSKPQSDEKQIASAIEQMQQAAEHKQLRSVMQYFTHDFRGKRQMNKAALQARIYFQFRHNPQVKVYVSNIDIQLEENRALVNSHLLVTGSQDVMPDKGRLYRIESSWRKDKGEWRIMRANWEDIIEQLVR